MKSRRLGKKSKRQQAISQCCILDIAHRCALARFTTGLWWLEKYPPPFLSIAGQWDMGIAVGTDDGWPRFWMANDRCKSCQSASPCYRCSGRQSGHGGNKRGLNTKIHLAVDAHGMPVRVLVTSGTTADCTQALPLIEGFTADYLLADRGYDSDAIIASAKQRGMQPVIPPKKNRRLQRDYDQHLYKIRHLVENAFLHLKGWRAIATRYAKNTASFIAAVQIRCLVLWAKILWRHCLDKNRVTNRIWYV